MNMLNLGGLFFTLDADTRGLQSAQRRVEGFAGQVRQAFRGMEAGKVTAGVANALNRQERSVVSFMQRIQKLKEEVNRSVDAKIFKGESLEKAKATLEQLSNQYDVFTRKMASGTPLNALDFGRRNQQMKDQLDQATRSLKGLHDEALRGKTVWGNATGWMHSFGSAALVVQGHFGGLSTRLFAFGNLVKEQGATIAVLASGIAGLSTGMGLLATHAVKSGMAMERLEVGFKALTGNSAVAATEIAYVRQVADQAGLSFDDTGKAYMRFLASAGGVLTLKQTQEAFKGVSLAAATMQLSVEDTQGVFRALDQMMSKGTVQAEELRGQLGDRLPGAFKIAAQAMGVTTAKLGDMMKKGQVMSADFVPKFVAQLEKVWGIDATKNINTLQASLTRLSNEWGYFGKELNRNTQAAAAFKTVVDGMIGALQGVSAYLPQIIQAIGVLTGAFIGLGAAMAINGLIAWIGTMGGLVAMVTQAIAVVRGLAVGTVALGAAMNAIPIVRVVNMLVTLVTVLGGAALGYNIMTEAVNNNNAVLANTKAIESYIDAQKRMGANVRATTESMMDQMKVQARANEQRISELSLGVASARREPSMMDVAKSALAGLGGVTMTPQEFAAERAKGMEKELEGALAIARNNARIFGELQDLNKLPDITQVADAITGKGSDGGKMSDNIDKFDDLILKMKEAEAVMSDLAAAKGSRKLVEDLYDARRAINGLNVKQLGKLKSALDAEGIKGDSLEQRMMVVVTRTRLATEAIKAFNSVMDDVAEGGRKLNQFQAQISFLQQGGASEGLDMFRGINDAANALKDLDPASKKGIEALTEIQNKLKGLGYEVGDTGNLLDDTTEGLARFYNKIYQAGDAVRVWANMNDAIRQAKDNLTDLQTATGAYGTNGGGLFGAATGSETEKALDRGRKVEQFRRSLLLMGQSQDLVNKKSWEYLEVLRGIDAQTQVYDRMKGLAEGNKELLKGVAGDLSGFFKEGTSHLKEYIKGIKDINEALMDLAYSVLDKLWARFIDMPIGNFIDDLGNKIAGKKTSGIDAMAAGLTGANDNGVVALSEAANKAASVLGGNLVSSIASTIAGTVTKTAQDASATATMLAFTATVNAATGALAALASTGFAAAASSGASSIGSNLTSAIGAVLGAAPARAMGGSMSAGELYRINEPGISGEYFIPSVNGYMNREGPANDRGGVYVDATTHINAQGADPATIQRLEAAMSERDRRLRRELPLLVDARVRDSSGRGRYT